MKYFIYGPIEMARDGEAISRLRSDKNAFWANVEKEQHGLSNACGCYVFILRRRAWYVGLAEKQSFKREIFQHHKLLLYGEALRSVGGRAAFIFIAKVTPASYLAKPSKKLGHRDARFLEKLLIGSALRRNPNLRNVKDTKLLRDMQVPGLLNKKKGEGSALAVRELRVSLGV